jgi:hypothetical protein
MVKYLLAGAAVGAATLLPAGFAWWIATAQTQPPVVSVCPKAVWMEPFRLFELNALAPDQYRLARVSTKSDANVRNRAGFESDVVFSLPRDATVTVMGESWDGDCNQWMKVSTDRGDYWMHGNTLSYNGITTEGGGGPIETPIEARPFVTTVCPKAEWMEPFRLFELNALAASQYHPARVNIAKGANVRDGVGFESNIAFALPRNATVTVIGESWDGDCNQWMQVRTDRGDYWMNGNTLSYDGIREEGEGPAEIPLPAQPFVTTDCPKAEWMAPFRLFELNELAPSQYHQMRVNSSDGANIRNGVGFASNVVFALPHNSTVTVIGEAWDSGCNQWMQVQVDGQRYWVHGNLVRK